MNIHRFLRYNLVARVAILTQATTTAALAFLSPASLVSQLLTGGGDISKLVITSMLVLTGVGWVDVLVNDCLRGMRRLRPVMRHEHMGYMLLGVCYWIQALVGSAPDERGSDVLVLNYLVVGGCCVWYGWVSALRGVRGVLE